MAERVKIYFRKIGRKAYCPVFEIRIVSPEYQAI